MEKLKVTKAEYLKNREYLTRISKKFEKSVYVKGIKPNLLNLSKMSKTRTTVAEDENGKIYNQVKNY